MSSTDQKIKIRIALELDEKWASKLTQEELTEYLEARINYSLGFRGRVKKMTPVRIK
jgi:hypothetical protein